ncbi:hypothetical protein B0J13DRAFT_546179 [Dactylonectria estremocensis]|uniref:Uncharacterized protein n=1 Tax=Dactylonectria estremocensis TaxID=1079267 RepID=A0A9P9F926_9HYPO|nr:hypothetical protein B0J13DRAFT_546179 [Dactylonectria estremocensis]
MPRIPGSRWQLLCFCFFGVLFLLPFSLLLLSSLHLEWLACADPRSPLKIEGLPTCESQIRALKLPKLQYQ